MTSLSEVDKCFSLAIGAYWKHPTWECNVTYDSVVRQSGIDMAIKNIMILKTVMI